MEPDRAASAGTADGAVVTSRARGNVRVLTLNRPRKLNAFTADGYRQLAAQLHAAADDGDVRVVVLTGAGEGFCSGVDLAALAEAPPDAADFSTGFQVVVDALITFPKPLVAAVHGVAVGFGFTLLLHCDIVVVADDARLRAPFAELGTAPEAGSSTLLPRIAGPQHAADLLFTARWITADEAVRWGLAARTSPRATLVSDSLGLADSIAELPPAAVAAAKRLMRRNRDAMVREALVEERRAAIELGEVYGRLPAR